MSRKILFVDDERSILKSLERLFFDFDAEVFVAESGAEGLQIMETQPMDVVVSDMKMPVMDGHQLLRKVKALYPGTTRIILSGYVSENDLFDSIIDGSNSLYLIKPWNGEELKSTIDRILTAREMYRNLSILEFANRLENLSMIPGIYNSVCQLIEQDADVSAIANVIERDPTVTASVLRVVNSAFFNIKTASINQAITFLGLSVVKSIVLSCSLLQSVQAQVAPFNSQRLVRHATRTNVLVSAIYAKVFDAPLPDSIATAGLLHNIGFVMFLHYFPERYGALLHKYIMADGKIILPTLEREQFGVTHAELGGYLLDWWALPYSIVECALFHNTPLHSAIINAKPVMAVHLASYYAWQSILPRMPRNLAEGIFDKLGMSQQQFERILESEIRG